jgi:SAM-dependent methyltransferase
VLEHIENPNQLLEEMYRTLEPGGYLFATVPCGQWLWGDIDKSLGHYRRYSKRRINEVVSQSGFTLIKSRYLFFTLVPPALLLRAVPFRLGIQKSREQVIKTVQSEQTPRNFVNKLMKITLALESIFSRVIPLPYGLTIFSVYKKNSV